MSINCEETGADRLWGSVNVCDDLPLALVFVISAIILWGAVFVLATGRYIYNNNTKALAIAKFTQYVQMWFYSMFHTVTNLIALFSFGDLLAQGQVVAALLILFFYGLSVAAASQIDVVGTTYRKPGINDMSVGIMIEYFFTTYLLKAVWKMTGTVETKNAETDPETLVHGEANSKKKSFGWCSDLSENVLPLVYDVKDVVGIQGAYLGVPALFTLLFTVVRSGGVESSGNEAHEFTLFTRFASVWLFFSAISGALFGDWETYSKSVVKVVASGIFRVVEVIARLGFYVFFLDFSRMGGFIVLAAEFAVMWCTGARETEESAAARSGAFSHKLLSCWESVLFVNYRRLSVDKETSLHSLGYKPGVERLRFLVREAVTGFGYLFIGVRNFPDEYLDVLGSFFWISVGANILVLVSGLAYFFVFNKSEVKSSDLRPTYNYLWSIPPLSLFAAKSISVNRDRPGFHYV